MSQETTASDRVRVAELAAAMVKRGLPVKFIDAAMSLALEELGALQLMELWAEAESDQDAEEAIADLQDLVDDFAEAPREVLEKPRISYEHLK
ncbi:MAG: hypothetical protein M3Y59_11530 [Myxococcota bacterium]|nr:hypothetical protein [Myxococcota bacterium]